MAKYRIHNVLSFLLVAAFLTMQWTTVHYHLSEHHDHDGNHHEHAISAHSHQLAADHADAIDSADMHDDHSIVELDGEIKRPVNKKYGDWPAALIPQDVQFVPKIDVSWLDFPRLNINKLGYLSYSSLLVRAPPRLS